MLFEGMRHIPLDILIPPRGGPWLGGTSTEVFIRSSLDLRESWTSFWHNSQNSVRGKMEYTVHTDVNLDVNI